MSRLFDAGAETGISMTLCFGSQVTDKGRLTPALKIGSGRFENSHIRIYM